MYLIFPQKVMSDNKGEIRGFRPLYNKKLHVPNYSFTSVLHEIIYTSLIRNSSKA